MGATGTVGGEAVRAAAKVYYDAYNNGFCNNTSNAINFLDHFADIHSIDFTAEYRALHDACVKDDGYTDFTPEKGEIGLALDTMVDKVVKWCLDNPKKARVQSDVDMYSNEYYEEFESEDPWEDMWDDEDDDPTNDILSLYGSWVCPYYQKPAFDYDDDCRVGIGDIAIVAGEWMQCGRLPSVLCE